MTGAGLVTSTDLNERVSVSASSQHGTALTPAQLEFLSEDELIQITPNFAQRPLHLSTTAVRLRESSVFALTRAHTMRCQAPVPQFQPSVPVMVPLWLALHLRVQDKCKIIAPDWMNVESLKTVLQREKDDLGHFEVLPFHYVEIAEQLLTVCDGDT